MGTPLYEQETIIRWYRDEDEATIYTSDTTMMTRFDKFVDGGDWKLVKTETCEGDIIAKRYKAPKELLYGRKVKSKGQALTEEQREARRIRIMKNIHDK